MGRRRRKRLEAERQGRRLQRRTIQATPRPYAGRERRASHLLVEVPVGLHIVSSSLSKEVDGGFEWPIIVLVLANLRPAPRQSILRVQRRPHFLIACGYVNMSGLIEETRQNASCARPRLATPPWHLPALIDDASTPHASKSVPNSETDSPYSSRSRYIDRGHGGVSALEVYWHHDTESSVTPEQVCDHKPLCALLSKVPELL